jgi:hypothetical protein
MDTVYAMPNPDGQKARERVGGSMWSFLVCEIEKR